MTNENGFCDSFMKKTVGIFLSPKKLFTIVDNGGSKVYFSITFIVLLPIFTTTNRQESEEVSKFAVPLVTPLSPTQAPAIE